MALPYLFLMVLCMGYVLSSSYAATALRSEKTKKECLICTLDIEPEEQFSDLPCHGAEFHRSCMEKWKKACQEQCHAFTCPKCRAPVPTNLKQVGMKILSLLALFASPIALGFGFIPFSIIFVVFGVGWSIIYARQKCMTSSK